MSAALITHIGKFVPLTAAEKILLKAYTKTLELKKKDFLLKEGQVCNANYFVESGCLRLFFTDEKGAEQTEQFAIENWWLTDFTSFSNQQPSQFFIQAVEHSNIIALEKKSLDELLMKMPQLERYFRLVLEKSAGAAQQRIKYIFSRSKEECTGNSALLFQVLYSGCRSTCWLLTWDLPLNT